jgi:hypothetical protein
MNWKWRNCAGFSAAIIFVVAGTAALADGFEEYGNENVLGTGSYSSDPKAGATLIGLAPDVVTDAALTQGHSYPFTPGVGDFSGTDQIYVGSVQTGAHDGYSGVSSRINGPDILTLDYSSLVPSGSTITSLTLGIAADDFQNAAFGQPFTATVNGTVDAGLTNELNSLNESGPVVHFFTIGVAPSFLASNNVLTLSIDEGGDGGDGYAVDFLTVGVTTTAINSVPEPGTWALGAAGLITTTGCILRRRRKR